MTETAVAPDLTMTDQVFLLAEEVMNKAKHVSIDHGAVDNFGKYLASVKMPESFWKPIGLGDTGLNIAFDIMASAVNYCYWYGSSNIRPNGSSSTAMYNLLERLFELGDSHTFLLDYFPSHVILEMQERAPRYTDTFAAMLARARFPMLEERAQHLRELARRPDVFDTAYDIWRLSETKPAIEAVQAAISLLVTRYPGFASDMFLKRACLAVMMIQRRLGIFEDGMGRIPVPADYQLPCVLRQLGMIAYSEPLGRMVDNGEHIPKGSMMEIEIRAATIMASDRLATKSGKSASDVDEWLWTQRKSCQKPFHLTITTDY